MSTGCIYIRSTTQNNPINQLGYPSRYKVHKNSQEHHKFKDRFNNAVRMLYAILCYLTNQSVTTIT